jgi:hypothetical protein
MAIVVIFKNYLFFQPVSPSSISQKFDMLLIIAEINGFDSHPVTTISCGAPYAHF